jgi:hypothetical protein
MDIISAHENGRLTAEVNDSSFSGMSTNQGISVTTSVRPVMATAGVLLAAAMVFEMVRHGDATLWTGPLALIGPDLAFFAGIGQSAEHGRLPTRAVWVYNLLHRPWLPLIMLVAVSVDGQSTAQAAPYFVAGLAWLLHITLDRALGYNLRAKDGSVRS